MSTTDPQAVLARSRQLYSADAVGQAIRAIAETMNRQLAGSDWLVLCVLNGGIPFCGILLPQLRFALTLEAVHATRYRGQLSGDELHWYSRPRSSLQGRHVLLVDDILDEGLTLHALQQWCREQGATEVRSVVLVDKQIGRPRPAEADFSALQVPDEYVFGYGMDYRGYLRNADGIYAAAAEDC